MSKNISYDIRIEAISPVSGSDTSSPSCDAHLFQTLVTEMAILNLSEADVNRHEA